MKKYIHKPELMEVYKVALTEAWNGQTSHLQVGRKQLQTEIKDLGGKLSYARDLLSSEQIEPSGFREMKSAILQSLERWKSN